MKKLIPLFCLLLCSIAMHAEVQTGSCGENLTWQYDTDTKALTITGTGAMDDYYWDTKPWHDVRQDILSISLPNGLTRIGDNAFYDCSSLISIKIPEGTLEIGMRAFNSCSKLTDASLPSTLTSIESGTFGFTPLTNVSIPNNCTTIGDYAFLYCNMTSIFIPASVTEIGNGAFAACNLVTSIVVDAANSVYDSRNNCNAIIETASNKLIAGCSNTIILNDIVSIGDAAFRYQTISSLDIPRSVTSIGDDAFSECYSLTAITIPSTVVSIGRSAFTPSALTSIVVEEGNPVYDSRDNCNAIIETASNTLILGCLSSTIPHGVLSIGGSAFGGCYNLLSIIIPNTVTFIGDNAFAGCNRLSKISIPNSVQTIDQYAFNGCAFSSVIIPSSVTSMSYGAFASCSQVTIQGSTPPAIEYNTFKSDAIIYVPCSALETYRAAENWSVFTLDGSTDYDIIFGESKGGSVNITNYDCANSSVTIEAVADNNSYQFSQWSDGNTENPRTLYLTQDTTLFAVFSTQGQCGDNLYWSFDADTQTLTITGTGDMWGSNGSAGIWWSGLREQIHHVSLPNGLTRICSNAFMGTAIESITIPSTVTKLDNYIFSDNANLISISVEEGNPVYDSRNNCNAIIEIATNRLCAGCRTSDIPATVTTIGQGAFFGCIGLQTITLPESIRTLESQAFAYCSDLASINLNNGLTTITGSAFDYCHKLTSIIIPSSVTSIGERLTEGCDNLVQIIVEEGNPNYDSRNNCNALIETATNTLLAGCQTTVIPEGITTIKSGAFTEQRNLTSITFPSTLQTIEGWAFPYCYSLGSVSIPSSVTYMGDQVFRYCWNIETITMEGATPPTITSSTFDNNYAEIHISCATAMSAYRAVEHWKDLELKGESGYNVNLPATVEGTAKVVGADCEDNSVTIQAVPHSVAYKFAQWSDGNTDNPRRVVLTRDTTLTPEFVESPKYIVTIQGMGVDVYYNDGTSIYFDYLYSDVQNITLTLPEGYIIGLVENGSCGSWIGWSDGSTDYFHTVTIESDTLVISRFDVSTYSVNISAGEGGYLYDYTSSTQSNIIGERNICNNEIEVEAHPNDGYYFVGWSDGVQWRRRFLALEQDTTITAIFAEIRPAKVTLGVDANSAGWGIVSGSGTYNLGDWILISATPNDGYHVVEWSDGDGFDTRYVYLTSDTTLYVTFAQGAYGGKCGESLYWTIANDTLFITGTGAMDVLNYRTWQTDYNYNGDYYNTFYFRGVVFPDGLTSIPRYAFGAVRSGDNYAMETIVIPATVEYIGDHAFASCYNIKKWQYLGNKLELGGSKDDGYNHILDNHSDIQFLQGPAALITDCGNSNDWYALDTLIITNGHVYYPNISYLDASKATTYGYLNGDYRAWLPKFRTLFLPEDLVEIGDFALMNTRYLDGVTIPVGVTRIGESAFEDCRSLDSVLFAGNNLKSIGDWAFYNCHDLKKMIIPEGTTAIGNAAFFNCVHLSELTIPSTMQRIADNGFGACAKMQQMYVNALVPPAIGAKTFEDVDRSIPVFVPKGTLERYQGDPYWSEFFNITEYDAPTGILNAAAQGEDNARKVLRNGQVLIIRGDQTYTVLGDKL